MSQLTILKSSTTLGEVANLLNYKPSSLSYILYYTSEQDKYHNFEIPKKTGGLRKINAPSPQLKLIQERLSELLQDCVEEVSKKNNIEDNVSHGFRRERSIISNAKAHRNRRYVFNVDIEDFFGNINFGRVFGFFLKDKNFELDKKVAAVIAKIACHEDKLPQGSPCSPVISNLIGHILDVHLVRLAKKHGCTYTRYADDLTFSTNNPLFPKEIAYLANETLHNWSPGKELVRLVSKSGFQLNPSKTRMQYQDSRQEVTGLIVNKKVNVRFEYRRTVRAMVHRLFTTGSFEFEQCHTDDMGQVVISKTEGNINQLHGMLGFIDSIDTYNKNLVEKKYTVESTKNLTTKETMYRRFLMFKEFYTAAQPTIICEGNTDNIYLTHAIRSLVAQYPQLAVIGEKSEIKLKVRLFKYTNTSTGRILKLSGGYSDLSRFIRDYKSEMGRFKASGKQNPVIVLYDNDSAAGPLKSTIKEVTKKNVAGNPSFVHIYGNLYTMATPLIEGGTSSCIEDFFDSETLARKVDGKSFDGSKDADKDTTYGKVVFAHKIVAAEPQTIDFNCTSSDLI